MIRICPDLDSNLRKKRTLHLVVDGPLLDSRGGMPKEIDERLFRFACRAVDVYNMLNERGGASREIARQYLRAATSIGANAFEASAGQTKADFLAKLGIARKECREVLFWLRLVEAKRLLPTGTVHADIDEVRQLAAILTAIVRSGLASERRGDL